MSQLTRVMGYVQQEAAVLVDSGEEFEVEKILDTRTSRNKKQYLVKWKNYSDFENQWIDDEHLENVREAIDDFERDLSRKTRSRKGSSVRA